MLRMKMLALAALPAALLTAPAVIAQAPSALDQVSQHLKAVDTMTANFSQTDRRGQVLGGKLTLKRPGKVRFQYQKGVPMLIVADGKRLNMIDYEVKRVESWPVGNSPLSVLLDAGKDLSRYAKIVPSDDPRVVMVEARDAKRPEYGRITLVFARIDSAPAGLSLQGWSVIDAQNNRTTVKLANQRFNVAVADSAFRWTDPRRRGPRA
ncbi:LolA family protein [Sphingosinicella rhizophila]|uniref:Outer membrane lipoprotein carrier protein LolA n=1 Tax=Sphingosinicella rhizophila TaxID=3050082 RepID=A0ABU3Q834_9SPHN|nr:outer membrane lipoprotein carrier protein LolA [Sphingosinicella sp. GR2756]MDT9599573.1 outer membrane lipoprotein carrier protein LolA [Sphingosinicella sp. GR2756]